MYSGVESLKSHARVSEDKFLISQYNNTEQVALTRHNGANIVEHDLPVHQNQCRKFFGRSRVFCRLRRKIIYVPFRARSQLVGGGYSIGGVIGVRAIEISASGSPMRETEWMALKVCISFFYIIHLSRAKRIDILAKLLLMKQNGIFAELKDTKAVYYLSNTQQHHHIKQIL